MQHIFRSSLIVVSAMALSGCIPLYQPAPGATTTRINLSNVPLPKVCESGVWRRVSVDSDGYGLIPAEQLVTLVGETSYEGYNVIYRCNPSLTFFPRKDISYFGNLEERNQTCYLNVFQEGAQSPTGLAHESTVRSSPGCSQ